MIQRAFITEWRKKSPWVLDEQIEQDLILSRSLVELYADEVIQREVAFRGGTALHKLYFDRPDRYSEDIDLVQVETGPIGAIMDAIHRRLDSWLGKPQWKQGRGRITFYYRFMTEIEPVQQKRLKVEINTREHFTELGLVHLPYEVESRWWSGHTEITTYLLEELLGTKLRALYQRKKGRDLFDIWIASQHVSVNLSKLIQCFLKYIQNEGLQISRAEFEANLHEKLQDPIFRRDIEPLLVKGSDWNQDAAAEYLLTQIIPLIPGESWKGTI